MGSDEASECEHTVNGVRVAPADELCGAQWDAVVVLLVDSAPRPPPLPHLLHQAVADALRLDASLNKAVGVVPCAHVSGGRLVVAPTGPLTPYDDVRSIGEAARAGVNKALDAGARRPVLALLEHPRFPRAPLVALLGALEALYVPLQIREQFPENALLRRAPEALGVYGEGLAQPPAELLRLAAALETARALARDIGGADPERMTPLRAAEWTARALEGGPAAVRVRVLSDAREIAARYPLFAAVDRAAASVPRHRGAIVFLEYEPESYERTVMLVGKGVTYDTGGCDVKAGGAMAGMSRDKCGAAAVAGFFRACQLLRPALKAVGALALVRNSVGEEGYVADELLRASRGLAVRVGNTDAEGRMAMADLLAEMAERARGERSPHVYTVATLTGHAVRAYGDAYTAAADNHVARDRGHAHLLRADAELLGDMVEVSTIRREDLATHRGRCAGDDVHQADSCASSAAPRGHQAPAAFLLLASGLDGGDVPYTHLDVAGSAGSFPAPPTGAPLLALAAHYGLLGAGPKPGP